MRPRRWGWDRDALSQLAAGLRAQGKALILDEAYCDFGGESMADAVGEFDNLLIVRTLSKSHALAGTARGVCAGRAGADRRP